MDSSQDQRKHSPSGHEIIHGVHLCRKCGWPFPNPHPSAKHRRAHKRICGTIDGYKLSDSGEHSFSAISDDENGSDEDRPTPSPKIERKSTNNSGDELFADAVTEFSDSGKRPVNEEQVKKVVVESDLDIKQQLKIDSTDGVVQVLNRPTGMSQMNNPKILEIETSLLGSAMPVEDIMLSCNSDSVVASNNRTDEVAVGLGSVNGSAGDLSHTKSETLQNSPKGHGPANVSDQEMESSVTLLEQETDVKGNNESNVEEVLSDVAAAPGKTVIEASEMAFKLQETDVKTSDSVAVDQIMESEEEQSLELGPTMSLYNLSPEVKSCEHMEVLVNTDHIESDFVHDRDVGNHGNSAEGYCAEGEGNENVHVLSVANDITAVDHPDILEDFKDHKVMKLKLPVTLDSGEVVEPVVDDKDTVCEENQSSFLLSKSGESIPTSAANFTAEDEGIRVLVAEVTVEGEGYTSEVKVSSKDLVSNGMEAAPEVTMTGEIQTDSHLEGQKPNDFHTDSSEDILPESTITGVLNATVVAISADDEASQKTNLSEGDNSCNHEKDKTEKCDVDEKEIGEAVKEEQLTNIKTSDSVDDLFVSKTDQTNHLIGAGNNGDNEKAGIEFSDLGGNERRVQEKPEMNSKMIIESACNLPVSKVVVDDGMNEVMKKLEETETSAYFVTNSSEANASHLGITIPTLSGSPNHQHEDYQEALNEFYCTNELPKESAAAACKGAELNHDRGAEVSQKIFEIPPQHLPVESDFAMKSSPVDDSHCEDGGLAASSITEYLQHEEDENLPKQPAEVPAVDVSVDSSSLSDSLEGNWGSISVLSTQSDAVAAIDNEAVPSTASEAPPKSEKVNSQKPKRTSEGPHSNKSDVIEPPSFMTLVEPGKRLDQKTSASDIQIAQNTEQLKSEALQAGWFPSLSNVVNESQGRKKNEEIIAKVTNWSTGKQHTPLKSLLGEANLESKPKSPNPKPLTVTKKDENTGKDNAPASTVNSIMGPADQIAKREMGREWNSPAKYPSDNKKEKRKVKGRPYWVPFVCCSSVN